MSAVVPSASCLRTRAWSLLLAASAGYRRRVPGGDRVDIAAELAFALELAELADGISARHFGRAGLLVESKADRSPVSEADREIETLIRRRLEATRPTHGVVGEEFGASPGASGLRWILDPIDGTRKFVRGLPGFATLIALEAAGDMLVGVASAPALGRRWWAGRGLGAFADDRPIRVSPARALAEAHVAHGSIEGWQRAGRLPQRGELSVQCWGTSGYGDFWSHVQVAEGAAEVALEIEGAVWDFAALQVIVEEAGGRLTDLHGRRTAAGGSAVSSNGHLHAAVLGFFR
jgi:histidinol-phosphatase